MKPRNTGGPHRPAPRPGFVLLDRFNDLLAYHALFFQLQMIVEQLERHRPSSGDPVSHEGRKRWAQAIGFTRAAATSLVRIGDALVPTAGNGKRHAQGKRGNKCDQGQGEGAAEQGGRGNE